jgi:Protein of unknown function (DUF3043)
VFGRDKTSAPPAAQPATAPESAKSGGKGRPTPTRREAEQRNRRPLIGAPPAPKGATRAERKVARTARQQVVREERQRARLAAANGDERYMPARDKGPARRFARDYVDARRNVGEFLLPVALISFLIGAIKIPAAHLISLAVLYLAILIIGIDSYLLRRRIQRLTNEKFGENVAAGTGTYALMRSAQFRRSRVPKPQVKRGEFPAGS